MSKNIILTILIAVVLVGGLAVMFLGNSPKTGDELVPQNSDNSNVAPENNSGNTNPNEQAGVPKTFTLADIAIHSSISSCYTVVNGNVYDVTAFASKHPGGEDNILKLCGKDGSAFFNKQHGGQEKPEATLASLKIGTLAK